MSRQSVVILKKGQFSEVEPRPLASSAGPAGAPKKPAKAKIIRQGPDGMIIEVVCGCGERIQLHCRANAAVQPSAGVGAQ